MLKTISKSANKKLGGCAATYRSGPDNVYSTCPSTCPLKPATNPGAQEFDEEYFQAVLQAVPENGVAWTYTHFENQALPPTEPGQTCVNMSTDSLEGALLAFQDGLPTVVVRPSSEASKVDIVESVRLVRCPAEYHDKITCNNCGGDIPLCARPDRNYVIKFTAHGAGAKKINQAEIGGCYGNGGPVRLQWEKTKGSTENDAETVIRFARSLPPGTKLRHHVVGDFGK